VATPRAPRKKSPPASKLHPFIKWMRTAVLAGFLVGLGGLFLTEWFWLAVAIIYVGFLVLLVDLWFEPELTNNWKIGIAVVIVALIMVFSWTIVIVPAPLTMEAIITDAAYPPGTDIHGIIWKKGFTELRLNIFNTSNRNYQNMSLSIQPVEPIAAIKQNTNIIGVVFYDNRRINLTPMQINLSTGQRTALPLVLVATDSGYTMHCPSLPGGTSIEIVMALAEISTPQPSEKPPIEDKNGTLRIRFDDGSSYWFGYADGDVYVPQPPSTQTVKVEGKYEAALRTRPIAEKLKVSGHLPLNLH
jgi:hypothetical protein